MKKKDRNAKPDEPVTEQALPQDETQEAADTIMDGVQATAKSLKDMAREALDRTDIDEKVLEAVKGLKSMAKEALDKTDIDEMVLEAVKDLKGKAKEALDKTDIDEKIIEGAKDIVGKIGDLFNGKE